MSQVKILFLASNPLNGTRLSLDEEVRGIERRLRASKYRDSIMLKAWWAVRPDDLLQALNEELPHIVHFSGHGQGQSGLIFHDNFGNASLVSGAALKRLFSVLRGNIRVVVLNACYSSEQAKAIIDCVDCVVGMNDSISDTAARKFAASFYRAIAFGQSIQNAFEQGLASLALEDIGQEDFPTLLVREGVKPQTIFLIKDKQLDVETHQPVLSAVELQHITKEVPNKRMQKAYGDRFLRNILPGLAAKIRYKEELSIIILDIDELTIINKVYGRHVGNNVIAAISRILFIEGGTEYSGRCGDDTYYVMMPGFDINKAVHVAEHLSMCVRNHPWGALAADLRVTCTFGVSQLQSQEPIRDWVIRAAIAVNDAKKGHRLGEIGRVEHQKQLEERKERLKLYNESSKPIRSYKELPKASAARGGNIAVAVLHLAKNKSREFSHYWS